MKIGEMAERLGTSISSLRFYEDRGLIQPLRTEKGTRIYNDEHLARFRTILMLADLGVPLNVIQVLARLRMNNATGNLASHAVDNELDTLEQALTDKLLQLKDCLLDIRKARHNLHACHGCRKRPLRSICAECPSSSALLDTAIMRIVWDE